MYIYTYVDIIIRAVPRLERKWQQRCQTEMKKVLHITSPVGTTYVVYTYVCLYTRMSPCMYICRRHICISQISQNAYDIHTYMVTYIPTRPFNLDLACDASGDTDVIKSVFLTVFPGLSNAVSISRIGPVVSGE